MRESALILRINRLKGTGLNIEKAYVSRSKRGDLQAVKLIVRDMTSIQLMLDHWPTLRLWGTQRKWNIFPLSIETGEVEFLHRLFVKGVEDTLANTLSTIRTNRRIKGMVDSQEDVYQKVNGFYQYHRQAMYLFKRPMARNSDKDRALMPDMFQCYVAGYKEVYELIKSEGLLAKEESNFLLADYPLDYKELDLE